MKITSGLSYSPRWVVDVYAPEEASRPLPIVVHVGGPGFHDHAGNVRLAKAVVDRGPVVVLSPQYELGYVADAFGLLEEFIAHRSAELGGKDTAVTVVGISSGAGPAAVWAFSDGLTTAPSLVGAYVGAGGLYSAFLAPLIGGHRSLRVRLVHGEQDASAPVAAAVRTDTALRDAGYDSTLVLRDGTHADTYDPDHPLGQLTIAAILETARRER